MKILVANLGSTSFKYRLFDMAGGGSLRAAVSNGSARRRAAAPSRSASQRQERPSARARSRRGGTPLPGATDRREPRLPSRCGGSLGDRLQDGPRWTIQRRAAGHARRARGDGGDVRRGPGAQSAVHRGDAAVGRETAGDSAGGGLRDRFPSQRSPSAIATTPFPTNGPKQACVRRWGFHGASHRYIADADRRTARPRRPADHLLPPGRLQFALCDSRRAKRRHQHGHEPAERSAAEQPRGRFRSLRLAADHEAHRQVARRGACRSWPTRAVCWASAA